MADLIAPHGGLTEPMNRTKADVGSHPKKIALSDADLSSLYRIGDGNDCCVEGGPQDRWGMYSFPLFEKLKAALPEFEQVAAFQAGGWRLSVRRASVDHLSRPLRSEFVTGNYFSTFGIRSFGGRLISDVDDRSAATLEHSGKGGANQPIHGGHVDINRKVPG